MKHKEQPSPLKWIDIGVNLTNKKLSNDLDAVLKRAHENNIDTIIITGTHIEASEQALNIATEKGQEREEEREGTNRPTLYATAGIHPHDAKSWSTNTPSDLRALLSHPKVVAVGEAGLDFNRNFSTQDEQIRAFEKQLELAAELKKPLFLHQRDAHAKMSEMLKAYRDDLNEIVIHCFTGTQAALFDYLDLDCHIGITGWICDERRGQALAAMVHNIPLNRLMLETDAPYLLPRNLEHPPKNRCNEPCYLEHIAHTVAQHCKLPIETLSTATVETTKRFFNIPNQPSQSQS